MADTASLVARVKTEGVEQAARQLDNLTAAAEAAEDASDKLAPAIVNVDSSAKKVDKTVKSASDKFQLMLNAVNSVSSAVNGLYPLLEKTNTSTNQVSTGAKSASTSMDVLSNTAKKTSTALTQIDTSAKAANDGFSKIRSTAGQVGFQVQDMVVQLQSGTSAFVAIGQQGSQLAGAFGPGGAVLGAVIALAAAVGGVLYKSLGNARASAEELQAAQDSLQKVLERTSTGAYETSDALAQLVLSGGSAAEQQALIASASQGLQTQMKDAALAVKEATDATSSWYYGNAIGAESAMKLGQETSQLSGFVKNLADDFGISSEEASKLTPLLAAVQKNSSPENIKALGDATAELVTKHGDQNSALVTLNATLQNWITLTRNAEQQQKALKTAQENATRRINEQNEAVIKSVQIGNLSDKERYKAQAEADKEAFSKRAGVTEDQIKQYNQARDEEARQDIARVEATEKKREEAQARTAANQEKRIENQAKREQKAADDFLAQVDRTSGDEIARINATEQQKLEELQQFQQQGLIIGQQYEQARTDIMLTAEDARQKELEKRQKESAEKQNQHDQFIADIQARNASELELIDIQEQAKADKAKALRDKGVIDEKEYQQALLAYSKEADEKKLDHYESTLGDVTSALKSSLGEGNALYKAAAITQTIIETYKGATAAYASLATIPVVGPALGIAAAAAITAAGLANVGKIRSAREQGGYLAAGQVSTIAERSKPEVIMPAGASRVRTAEQMRQIMGDNGGKKNAGDSVVIVNNTTGRVDSVQTERDEEGRLRVLIEEHVASSLQDSNSKISKSRRSTRNSPGF